MLPTPSFHQHLMSEALTEARLAAAAGEVPIGCVIAIDEKIIGRGHNQVETRHDASAHAEMLAIQQASNAVQNWRLTSAVLCVTLEPCTMCLGAMKLARIPTLIMGAGDSRFGAVGTVYDLSQETRTGPVIEVVRGVLVDECTNLLKQFFAERRRE